MIKGLISSILIFPLCVVAQKIETRPTLSLWKQGISVDGNLDDWEEGSFLYNKETRLWYSLANDDSFLYLAVKKDENAKKVFTWGGLLFSLNKQEKESGSSVAFPLAVKDDRAVPHDQLTSMLVEGFFGIPEKQLNLYNEYGIQIGWTLEKDNDDEYADPTYRYELAIPLIHLTSLFDGNEIKVNILLRGFRDIRPSEQDIALIEQMEISMQEKLRQAMSKKMPNLPMGVINRNIYDSKDQGRWSEFTSSYRLATNPK